MFSFFPSFLQSVVSGKHLQCPQEASASSPAPSASDLSTPVSPELSSNGAFLYSYGNFIDQAPLGQVVNIVENQDGLDKNTASSNSGNGSPQTPGSKDNSVQVGDIFCYIVFFVGGGGQNAAMFSFCFEGKRPKAQIFII